MNATDLARMTDILLRGIIGVVVVLGLVGMVAVGWSILHRSTRGVR